MWMGFKGPILTFEDDLNLLSVPDRTHAILGISKKGNTTDIVSNDSLVG